MANHAPDPLVSVTSRWDRPAVATGTGETWLVVTVATAIPESDTPRPPVDVAFVIDRSGSMSGLPLQLAKQGVLTALDQLNDEDGFSVVAYDDVPLTISRPARATGKQRTMLAMTLAGLEPGGSTNLFGGWDLGCQHLMHPEFRVNGRVRRAILLTDGLANVGLIDSARIAQEVSARRAMGISTSTLGLGTGIDEAKLSAMAEAGGGSFAWVEHARDLPGFFARELNEAISTVASGATITLTLPAGVRGRLLNPFPGERIGKRITVSLGELPAGITIPLVFSITTRATDEGRFPPLALAAKWQEVHAAAAELIDIPVDPLMAVSPADFDSMPRDEQAATAAARMIADDAQRQAMRHYRSGDVSMARQALGSAARFAASAPAGAGIASELDEMMAYDPSSPEFQLLRRKVESDAHRRSRGRDV
jgi:Ca-activated chloride channel family protein